MGAAVPIIDRDPAILDGTPCFRGTLVPFQNLLDSIAAGETMEEFLEDFPAIHARWRLRLWNSSRIALLLKR
jgi:uncharacterized protein (DUF433 family)